MRNTISLTLQRTPPMFDRRTLERLAIPDDFIEEDREINAMFYGES